MNASILPDSHPELYPYVLLSMSFIALQCYLIPVFITVPSRRKVFNKEFMDQFRDMHKDAHKDLNQPVLQPHMGFPDVGSGRFS
jgi:hypothetical protein